MLTYKNLDSSKNFTQKDFQLCFSFGTKNFLFDRYDDDEIRFYNKAELPNPVHTCIAFSTVLTLVTIKG